MKVFAVVFAIGVVLSLLYCLRYTAWWEGKFLVNIPHWLKQEGFWIGIITWLVVALLVAFIIWIYFVYSGLFSYLTR